MHKTTKKHLWDTQISKRKITKYYLSITYSKMGLTTVEVRKKAQTGPAVRGDFQVMDRHYQFLNYNDQIAEIYKLISQDIIDSY
jgi:hypothetical protein